MQIEFDPKVTSYVEMLKLFWQNHDSTRCASRQYMSAIFYHDDEQKRLAEETRDERQKTNSKKIVTRITEAETFYDAENYHQKYLLRQQNDVCDALGLSDKELITSHIATRLNGYVGGHGKLETLEKEMPSFNLPDKVQERVRRLVGRGSGW